MTSHGVDLKFFDDERIEIHEETVDGEDENAVQVSRGKPIMFNSARVFTLRRLIYIFLNVSSFSITVFGINIKFTSYTILLKNANLSFKTFQS